MRELTLPGVRSYELNILPDARGFFAEAFRQDWSEFIDENIFQANISYSFPGVVRAWHKHLRGQVDYFLVLKGSVTICAFDENTGHLAEVVGSDKKLTLIRIPGSYLHGTKTNGNEPSLTMYFVNRLYDSKSPDEIRKPWNDENIIPIEINGNIEDNRVGRPWDWFYPPYK